MAFPIKNKDISGIRSQWVSSQPKRVFQRESILHAQRLGQKIRFDFARRVIFSYQDWPRA
jgi:hypothetical protein